MKTRTDVSTCIRIMSPLWLIFVFLLCYLSPFVMSQDGNGSQGISEQIPEIPGCRIYETDELITYVVYCSEYDVFATPPLLPVNTIKVEIYRVYDLPTDIPLIGNLSQLHKLSVTNCKLNNVSSAMFRGLSNLKYLSLKDNSIKELEKDTFVHNSWLEEVDLSANYFLSIGRVTRAMSELQNLRTLTLLDNMLIRHITKEDFFPIANISLETLDLSGCPISHVEEMSFVSLASLTSLDVSNTALDHECLTNLSTDLRFTNISELKVSYLRYISGIVSTVMNDLSKLNIEFLDLSYNRFPSFPSPSYTYAKLKHLDLTSCTTAQLMPDSFKGMTNLETLILKRNQISKIGSEFSPLRNLKHLDLSEPTNEKKGVSIPIADYAFQNQGKLEILNMPYFPLRKQIGRFMLRGLYSLKHLSMGNSLILGIQDFTFETLGSLEMLSLSDNLIESIHNNTFFGLKSVKVISLNNNGLSFLNDTCPFDHTPSLQTLDLNNNKISHLPPCLFAKVTNIGLIRVSNNFIIPWKTHLLPWKENLTAFGLSSNKITFFTSFMLDDLKGIENVDFSYNPLNCSVCGMLELQTWMRGNNTSFTPFRTFSTDEPYYTCYSPPSLRGNSIVDVEIPTSHCLPVVANIMMLLISLLCPIFATIFLSLVIWHFWRWNIKYCCFHLKLKVRSYRDNTKADDFVYDAFVSHSHSDVVWVRDHLLPALENREPKSRLCVPDRDFNASWYTTENVLNAVSHSRTTILLLSKGYLESQWCQFDLDMALHKLFEDTRNGLILVLLGEIEKSKLTKNLKYIMRTRTCIPWTENPIGQKLFWQRLRLAVAKPSEKDLLKHIT